MKTRNVLLALLAVGMFSIPALGQACQHFNDRSEFRASNVLDGKFNKGIEDFEEAVGAGTFKQPIPAPLQGNVPNMVGGIGFPNGLTTKNLIIQDNITLGASPPTPNPSGDPAALYVAGAGFGGSNSKKIGEDIEVLNIGAGEASLDLIFTEPNHTGVGFDLSQFDGFGTGDWTVTIYNKADQIIGTAVVPSATEPTKNFYGVWCAETIGRINIWDEGQIPDAIDNIEMWEDLPGGACCDKYGNCTEGTRADCEAIPGGTYQGDGTDCATADCPRIIPAITEWGLLAMILIGLAVGTVVFRRRLQLRSV